MLGLQLRTREGGDLGAHRGVGRQLVGVAALGLGDELLKGVGQCRDRAVEFELALDVGVDYVEPGLKSSAAGRDVQPPR